MKILFIEQNRYGNEDMKEAFRAEGHRLALFSAFEGETSEPVKRVAERLSAALHLEIPDIVFSINYHPTVSEVCDKEGVRYISWIFDSPYIWLYSQTVLNPCNQVYVFDKSVYLEFRDAGVDTVRYLPLAVNTDRLDALLGAGDVPAFQYDVSFVGSFYMGQDEPFDRMVSALPDLARGYLDAVMAAQMKIWGYDFIEEVLGPIMEDLYRAFPLDPDPRGMESREHLYAQYVIDRRITALERIDLLSAIAKRYKTDIFTDIKDLRLPDICVHGQADHLREMPWVFRQSRIDLNISRRGLKSGIPLKAYAIMGSGGFLLSNFQADFLDSFVPGEDFVYYESKEDLLQKVDHYLRHEDERQKIARNGHDKVAAGHTYRHRVREMLS